MCLFLSCHTYTFSDFLSDIFLPHVQLWAITEMTACLNQCWSLNVVYFDRRVTEIAQNRHNISI